MIIPVIIRHRDVKDLDELIKLTQDAVRIVHNEGNPINPRLVMLSDDEICAVDPEYFGDINMLSKFTNMALHKLHATGYICVLPVIIGNVPKDKPSPKSIDEIPIDDKNDAIIMVACERGGKLQSWTTIIHEISNSMDDWKLVTDMHGPIVITDW